MTSLYCKKQILTETSWNNTFAWEERMRKYGTTPTLTIPSLIDGTLDDVREWDDIVFEEMEDGVLRSCKWLQYFVRIIKNDDEKEQIGVRGEERMRAKNVQEIVIFDNHNHALYFWIDAVRRGIVTPGFELIHIDEHSDLWANEHTLDLDRALEDDDYAWQFTNLECNVGNYIRPAIDAGLVGSMIRIENEYQIDEHLSYTPSSNSVLNIDIDIFAPELDHIPEAKKIMIIQHLIKQVRCVTIATSPYFIDQWTAINQLRKILD